MKKEKFDPLKELMKYKPARVVEVEQEDTTDNAEMELVERAFEALATALATILLATSDGSMRQASSSEFMHMLTSKGWHQMKHAYSRNYVFINVATGEMYVPKTPEPFQRGTFDVFCLG